MSEPGGALELGGTADDRAAVLARLAELVGLDSPSGDADLLAAARDCLSTRLRELGVDVEVITGPAGDHLRGSLGAAATGSADRRDRLLLIGHYDTVWPAGEARRRPLTVNGDEARGPGVFDMKGSLVALEHALALIRRRRLELPQPVEIVIVADEEVSSPTGRDVVMDAAARARAVLGLEPPHPDGALKTGRRGTAIVGLTVTGREAHAGLDAAAGVSAIDELVDQLVAVRSSLASIPGLELNVGRVSGGSRHNVVAGHATAQLGIRIAAAEAQNQLLRWLETVRPIRDGAAVTAEVVAMRPVWPEAPEDALVAHVSRLAALDGSPIGGRPAGGAGDTNFTGAAGIPTVDGLGPQGHGAHSLTETVRVSSILRQGELLCALLTTPLPAEV